MKADEWKYFAEGGKHALFAYQPILDDEPNERWNGSLLRIDKDDLTLSSRLRTGSNLRVVSTLLEYYVDIPDESIQVTFEFLRELSDQAIASGRIPSSRLAGWSAHQDRSPQHHQATGYQATGYQATAFLIPNYRLYSQSSCISIEIKPKAGYRAFSPLVDPKRIVKYHQSRFAIHQQLYQQGLIEKGWAIGKVDKSLYDPLDLFSGQRERISKALDALVACPQNNLKVWRGDELLLGFSNNVNVPVSWGKVYGELQIPDRDDSSVPNEILTEILSEEPLLGKLLDLQMLDILDADGAILIYRHLVVLCGNSNERAESMLDDSIQETCIEPCHALLRASPIQPPCDFSRIHDFCNQVETFRRCLATSLPALPSKSVLEKARTQALESIQSFDADDCVYLLQNWLLSLSINDVSVFVSLKTVELAIGSETCVWSQQSCHGPGVLVYNTSNTCQVIVNYSLKVIDYDQKPAKKLRHRDAKEKVLDKLII
jgi:hypothetical protein